VRVAVAGTPTHQRANGDRNRHRGQAEKDRAAQRPAGRAEHAGGH
jgi:hypothetical protein